MNMVKASSSQRASRFPLRRAFSKVEKHLPLEQRTILRRTVSTRETSTTSKESSPVDYLSISTFLSSDSSADIASSTPRRISSPLLSLTPTLLDQEDPHNDPRASVIQLDHNEIQKKLQHMLLATAELKTPTSPDTPSGHRMSVSKMVERFSNAMIRRHSSPRYILPTKRSSVTSMDLRFNEGVNLNRKKVQTIVGSKTRRKPIANDGHTIRSPLKHRKSPFDYLQGKSPSESRELVVPYSSKEEHTGFSTSFSSPFGSEEEFEDDLGTSILKTIPEAASTPRRMRSCGPVDDCSPCLKSVEVTTHRLQSSKNKGTGQAQLATSQMQQRKSIAIKKHPSPDRIALDDLESDLQQLLTPCTDTDLDELSLPPPLVLCALAPQDRNRRMFKRSRSVHHAHKRDETKGSSQTHRRFAYRPLTEGAEDADELL